MAFFSAPQMSEWYIYHATRTKTGRLCRRHHLIGTGPKVPGIQNPTLSDPFEQNPCRNWTRDSAPPSLFTSKPRESPRSVMCLKNWVYLSPKPPLPAHPFLYNPPNPYLNRLKFDNRV
ncbi:Hypothetical predicted protein [Pelobates cultripes]|uniref:Uncharacterized protein n=1 Tax=Pelobates cultripes TaxID=61616 RepID=A0AAD1QZK5_PELCU|nr:Hypothetical predicted protein [Pelobates cultripes]